MMGGAPDASVDDRQKRGICRPWKRLDAASGGRPLRDVIGRGALWRRPSPRGLHSVPMHGAEPEALGDFYWPAPAARQPSFKCKSQSDPAGATFEFVSFAWIQHR